MQERAALLSAERRQEILERLGRDGKVVAARLVEELGVSEDTIRRDLRELAAHGLVQRVHGGALAPAPQPGTFAHRAETCTEEKAALAAAAVAVLGDARVVLIDGSTTNLELARRLPAEPARTILTNSPPIAAQLPPTRRPRSSRSAGRSTSGLGHRRRAHRRLHPLHPGGRMRARRLCAASRRRG